MNGFGRVTVMTAALFSFAAGTACAEPLEATLSVTVNALSGKHEIDGGHSDKLSFAPLPLAELTLRSGMESLRLEGLPPVTFGYDTAGDGALSTRLSILNATYRHTFPGGWFVGAGQTVYNQFTTYVPVNGNFFYQRGFVSQPITGAEAQYSRVTGIRVEAGRTLRFHRDSVDVSAAVNPHMHGIQYTRIPTSLTVCQFPSNGGAANCAQQVFTFADPENASQVDLSARVAHRISKHGELLYGLRYLNYSAHYDDFPGKTADRNVGFAPVLGYRAKL
ncbi:MAG: hypothetical protein QOJ39_1850 [Candidatus Eremiobacteraeota bacterium]|jgi:hypothetical protein|nr:hypothetical protein [Candidatus Eremiobacteraeota bacterium]